MGDMTFSALDGASIPNLGFAQTGIPYGLLQLPLSRYQRTWSDVAKGMLAGMFEK